MGHGQDQTDAKASATQGTANRRTLRWGLACLVGLTFTLLVSSLHIQRGRFEAEALYQGLLRSGEVLPLESFTARFLACADGNLSSACSTLEEGVPLRFPDVKGVAEVVAKLPSPPTHVVLRHPLTPRTLDWVSKARTFSLIALRNVHVDTALGEDRARVAVGNGSTIVLTAGPRSLANEQGEVVLSLTISGLPWFGPGEFPFLLVTEQATARVQELAGAHASAAALGRQLQLAIPFVLAVLALFLDHAPLFQPLALLAALRALRAFFALSVETPWGESLVGSYPVLFKGALGLLNGGMAAAFFFLAASMAGPHLRLLPHIRRRLVWILPALATAFLAHAFLETDAWITGDTLADTLGAGGAGIVLSFAAFDALRRSPGSLAVSSTVADLRRARIERATEIGALFLGAALFLLLALANAQDLSSTQARKVIIDWRYALFYPGLLLLAFVRVGASSKVIEMVSRDLLRKKLLEAELSTAKKQMLLMQGQRKGTSAGVSWRVWQRQCVSVGGDFFDVRTLTFEDGELVVAVVIDVTGHGIQAAMIARSLSDAWATWCADTTRARRREDMTTSGLRPKPSTREERESLLSRAPGRLLAHLSAAREPGSCTAIFALLDSSTRELTLCNAGHPSAMLVGSASHRTLTPKGKHSTIAGSNDEGEWTPNTFVLEDETLFLFSDGLFSDLLGVRPAVIAKRFRLPGESRTNPHDPKMLWKLFRMTQRFYSSTHPEDEDDITLVALSLPKVADLSKVPLNQEPICLPKGA